MGGRADVPRTHDTPRRLASDERSATQRTANNGGGAMRTNRALAAEGRTARADRASEAVTLLDGSERSARCMAEMYSARPNDGIERPGTGPLE
jgi:hypothetical protein